MRRYLVLLFAVTLSLGLRAQMSDTQVMQFVQREAKAGTPQSQIITKLVQRGVKMDQIRRIRAQYQSQIQKRGAGGVADAAVEEVGSRMRQGTSRSGQALSAGQTGTDTELEGDADLQYLEIQQNINEKEDTKTGPDSLRVFGRDIFNSKLLSFEPNMNIATPQNYVLGPGDEVIIDIYGASQKSEQLTVSPDGTIVVTGYGPIQVSGLTVSAAQQKIRRQLGSRYSSSSLSVTVGQTRTISVNVLGEVKVPGTYTISAFATVFHALYLAGGINDIGTLRNIKVFRNGKAVTVVDVYEFIMNGRLAGNIRLQEGDVVQVSPYDCLVGVSGSVKRPMFYEMRSTETLATLIKYAGGFTGDAYTKAVRVTRRTGSHYSVATVEEFDMSSFKVADGDAVLVDGILNRYENMVEVRGAVFRPGQFELGNKVTSVRQLVEAADGLTEDAFTNRAVLTRMKDDRTLETLPIDLKGIMAGTSPDVPLRNEDILFVPTQADRVSERTITIEGQVMSPGTYEYADNTTLEDMVLRAGGLTDAASTAKVDVSRRIRDPKALKSGKEISKTYSFALKDGFVIDGTPGFVLEPYDIVQVRRSPGYMEPRNITVEGEVNFEGSFTLEKKNQRLSDAIKAAGGVTDEAYVKGARLLRTMTDDERARMQTVIDMARQNQSERDSINLDQLETSAVFPVGINLEKALANPGGDYDIVLRDGDRLIVPEYNGTVKISGNVMFPNTVAFTKSKGFKWYVNQAGGFGNRAKKSKTYIVYQNGTVSKAKKGDVEPGCELVVPTKPKKGGNALAQWLAVGTSVASLATMFATIANLVK